MSEPLSNTANLAETPISITTRLPNFTDLLPEQVTPYWAIIQDYPIAEATVIILIFWCLAYIIRRFAINALLKLASKTNSSLDDEIINHLRHPIFSTVFIIGTIIAINSAALISPWLHYATPLLSSMVILIWLKASLTLISLIIKSLSNRPNKPHIVDQRMEPLLVICGKILIILVSCYVLLLIWGINPMGLLASAGIVGIAVGFAAKDTLANLFSGVFILADTPYKLGDYINLDGGERGKVSHIGIRSTRLLTRDDIEITIPNGIIGNAKVINESGGRWKKMRLRLNVQVAYESDLDQACDVLMTVANEQDDVCNYPTARVRVRRFADSGINLQLLCWIDDPEDRGRILHELHMATHKAFKQHDIEIPYPKRALYINNSVS